MDVKNNTDHDFWFGPLLVPANATDVVIDDTSATSLYLTNDAVADAINNLATLGSITVTNAGPSYPRATGTPQVLHGDGSPEGLVYAGQGSIYMRRDSTGSNSLYTKTTGSTLATGWQLFTTGSGAAPARKTTAKTVTDTVTDTDLLNGEISVAANALVTTGLLRLTAWGDWLTNTGSSTDLPRFKLKLGSTPTVVLDTNVTGTAVATSGATRYGWRIIAEVMNLGAANSQWVTIGLEIGYARAATGGAVFATGEGVYDAIRPSGPAVARALGANSAAIDTTAPMAVLLTVINPSATATCETKLYGALVEIL